MILFVLSALLSIATSVYVAKLFRTGAEQFWAGLLGLVLPWGLLANVSSIGSHLTTGTWILGQSILGLSLLLVARRCKLASHPLPRVTWPPLDASSLTIGAVSVTVLFILFLGVLQTIAQPLNLGDEMGYHGPRVLYWIGNGSIFPFDTHNDRQNVFGYQAELAFLWAVLFTRSELIGSLVFGLAGPLSVFAVYLVARKGRASTTLGLLLALLYLSAPLVFRHLSGLKPELWSTLFLLGSLWWTLKAFETDGVAQRRVAFLMAGLFGALAVATKLNALAFVPVLLLSPWIIRARREPLKDSLAAAAGFAAGAAATGLVVLLTFSLIREGGPFGSKEMVALHSADRSFRQIRTHLARFPLVLFDLPRVPSASLRTTLEMQEREFLQHLDASKELPLERPDSWPGTFVPAVPPEANRFSVAGLLALFTLLAATVTALVEVGRTLPSVRLSRHTVVFLFVASLTVAIIFLVRWMTHSGVPDRFLIPCVGCLLALSPPYLAFPGRTTLVTALLSVSLAFSLPGMVATAGKIYLQPVSLQEIEGHFAPVAELLPPSAKVLLFCSQHRAEYGLFGPREGFSRRIIPWGKKPFEVSLFQAFLAKNEITHVLFDDPEMIYFGWGSPLAVKPFVAWLAAQPAFHALDTGTPQLILFANSTAKNTPPPLGRPPALVSGVPETLPLVTVAPALTQAGVGLDRSRFSSPWPIENLGQEEKAFLWIGSGAQEGFRFRVWSQAQQDIALSLRLSAGPSRTDGTRTVELARSEDSSTQRKTLVASGQMNFPVTLRDGWNSFVISVPDQPNVGAMPNGDSRHLMVGIHDIVIVPPQAPGSGGGL